METPLLARVVVAAPAVLALNVVAMLVLGPTRGRKGAALVLSTAAFAVAAAFPPPLAAARGWLWFAATMMWMRVVDGLSLADQCASVRLGQLLLVYDPRDMRPAAPRLAVDLLARAGLYGVLTAAALALAAATPIAPARWFGGAVFFYALLEALDGWLRAVFAAMGLRALPLQDQPLRARTLTELWGRRWNREVGRWIHRACFRPLARRGLPLVGVLAGFTFSAAFHGAATWAAVDARTGLVMASFFVVHGMAVLIERSLQVARWPRWAGHAWVAAVFVVTLPLFAEPIVRLMGVPPLALTTVYRYL